MFLVVYLIFGNFRDFTLMWIILGCLTLVIIIELLNNLFLDYLILILFFKIYLLNHSVLMLFILMNELLVFLLNYHFFFLN
jgi:hypothetical protein